MRGEAGLGELVEDHLSRPLRLYVYNHEYDVTRLVTITPERGWGGSGALGCVLGFGALHRLPRPLGEPMQGPGETLFETTTSGSASDGALDSSTANTNTPFVPLNSTGMTAQAPPLISPSAPPPPLISPSSTINTRKPKSKPKTRHTAVSPHQAFDEYFAEGEQRSKEEDFVPSTAARVGGTLPPPPKGGPSLASAPAGVEGEEEKMMSESGPGPVLEAEGEKDGQRGQKEEGSSDGTGAGTDSVTG